MITEKIVICVVIGIVILEAYALSMGINGILLTTVIAVLAGLGGLVLPQLKLSIPKCYVFKFF